MALFQGDTAELTQDILQMYRSGSWNYLTAARAASGLSYAITDRLRTSDDAGFGATDLDCQDTLELCEFTGVELPASGPLTGALLSLLADRLIRLALEWFQDYLDSLES